MSRGKDAPLGQRQGGVFRLPPPYLWTPPTPQRAKGYSPLTILKKKSKHKKASAAPVGAIALTLFSLLHLYTLSRCAPAPPRGERALARSATLSQKAALQMLSAVTTPTRENAMPGGPQTARHCSIISNSSAEYAQSSAERIQIVFLRTAPLPPDAPAKRTAMPRRTGSPP